MEVPDKAPTSYWRRTAVKHDGRASKYSEKIDPRRTESRGSSDGNDEGLRSLDTLMVHFEDKTLDVSLPADSIADSRVKVSHIHDITRYTFRIQSQVTTLHIFSPQRELEDGQKSLREYEVESGDALILLKTTGTVAMPEFNPELLPWVIATISTNSMEQMYQRAVRRVGQTQSLVELELMFLQFLDELPDYVNDDGDSGTGREWVEALKAEEKWLEIPQTCIHFVPHMSKIPDEEFSTAGLRPKYIPVPYMREEAKPFVALSPKDKVVPHIKEEATPIAEETPSLQSATVFSKTLRETLASVVLAHDPRSLLVESILTGPLPDSKSQIPERAALLHADEEQETVPPEPILALPVPVSKSQLPERASLLDADEEQETVPLESGLTLPLRDSKSLVSENATVPDAEENSETDEGSETETYDWDSVSTHSAIEMLEARLDFLLDPRQDIEEALQYKNSCLIAVMLEHHINDAAMGKDIWIRDLMNIHYSNIAIAQLIYERKHESPWIHYKPSPVQYGLAGQDKPNLANHLPNCAHKDPTFSARYRTAAARPGTSVDKEWDIVRTVQELCGLGGITPRSWDRESWTGTSKFFGNNTRVQISYSLRSSVIVCLADMVKIARKLCVAFRVVQEAELCCNCFTVLKFDWEGLGSAVEVQSVPFGIVKDLLNGLKVLRKNSLRPSSALLGKVDEASLRILNHVSSIQLLQKDELKSSFPSQAFALFKPDHGLANLLSTLNAASLALQTLCVGFLSYCQAHIGHLQPFFLDTPVKEVVLLGINLQGQSSRVSHVRARLVNLTCLEGMCQGPVMAFQLAESSTHEKHDGAKFDVRSSPEDILDTWGPGQLVFRSSDTTSPLAIKIGGGCINPPVAGDRSAKYHWESSLYVFDSRTSPRLNMKEKILVGGQVAVNHRCSNKEKTCWETSSIFFEELGTYQSYVETAEYQFGFQGGPDYFAATGNKVWAKRRGRTIKETSLERGDDGLVGFLHCHWGLRVSYCTSIAQRISLVQLVGDLLPAFAKGLTGEQRRSLWDELVKTHSVICRFQKAVSDPPSLSEWLSTLPDNLFQFLLGLIRQILTTLRDTGLGPDGKYFVVAWPYDGTLHRCFRFQLANSDNKWMAMLADSDDCATFAYMTNDCLESHSRVCRGPHPTWDDRIHMLETAVLNPHNKGPSSRLSSDQTYFFRKLDGTLFWVKALRDSQVGANAPIVLERLVSIQSLPRDVMQRLLVRDGHKMQKRLRERDLMTVAAETVYVVPEAKGKGRFQG